MILIVILGILIVWALIWILGIYLLAIGNIYYTRIRSNRIKFVMLGETMTKILHNVKGYMLRVRTSTGTYVMPDVSTLHLAEFIEGEEDTTWFQRRFGIFWIGHWPWNRILTFEIEKEEEDPTGSDITKWIVKKGKITTDALWATIPRPFLHQEVELGGRSTVDFMTATKLRVVRPYIPIGQLNGKFFTNTASILNSEVNKLTKKITTQDDFAHADKSETTGYLAELKAPDSNLNVALLKQVGLVLDGISVPIYDPHDKEVREAMRLEEIALLKKKEIKVLADAYAERIGIESQADKARLVALAEGKKEQILAIITPLQTAGANGTEIAETVSSLMEAEMLKDTKLSTYVKGGKAKPVIPITKP